MRSEILVKKPQFFKKVHDRYYLPEFECAVCTMRMRKIVQKNTLREYADKFLSYKKAQKVSQRTYKDYQKYLDDFIEKSQNIKASWRHSSVKTYY